MLRKRALVVDDETTVRRLCGRIMEGLGYQAAVVSNGLEALKEMEQGSFDVAVVDLRLPDIDGIQLLKSIKKRTPQIDVIVITGYATIENAVEAMKEGATDYLRKPFSPDELQMVVSKCEATRKLAEEKSDLQELVGIYDLSAALSSTMLLDEVLNLFLDLVTRVLRTPKAILLLLDHHSGTLYVDRSKGLPEDLFLEFQFKPESGPLGEALNREKPSRIEFPAGDAFSSKLSEAGEPPQTLLCAPLVARGKMVGGLLVYPKKKGELFDSSDERAIFIMAHQAAIAIENARLLEDYQRRIAELTQLNEMAQWIESNPNDRFFYPSLAQSLEGLLPFDVCAFLLSTPRGGKLRIFSSLQLTDALKRELKEKMVQEFGKFKKGKTISEEYAMDYYPRSPMLAGPPLNRFGAMLFLPLAGKERPHGLIGFARAKDDPFNQISLKTIQTIIRIISLALDNQQFFAGRRDNYLAIVRALSSAAETKDTHFRDHAFYTAKYAKALAQKLGFPQEDLDKLIFAALLHDIGKIGIPESILNKPKQLSPQEYEIMQRHPKIGGRILESVIFPWDLKPLILSHHEHFDGSGYPSGLKGEEIPLGARILAIAEAYEIMTTGRAYKRALSPLEASKSLAESAGTHFDPQLIAPFLEALDSDRKD